MTQHDYPPKPPSSEHPRITTAPDELNIYTPNLKVVGIGGGGGNAINYMVDRNLQGVEFIAINTDAQDLLKSKAQYKVQIGARLAQGLGAGGDPISGQQAAEEDHEKIKHLFDNSHMIFLTTGLGGGTGSGATPVIARIIRQHYPDTLLVAVVTLPFRFEGPQRIRNAQRSLEEIKQHVDSYIVIPNDNIIELVEPSIRTVDAFALANDVLYKAVSAITDMIVHPGYINVDFADVYNVLRGKGRALFGVGYAEGDDRHMRSVQEAINCPLLENTSMEMATHVLINIAGNGISIHEVQSACDYIYGFVDQQNSHIIFGFAEREDIPGFYVSIIAAGFQEAPERDLREGDIEDFMKDTGHSGSSRMKSHYTHRTPTPTTLERAFDEDDEHESHYATKRKEDFKTPSIRRIKSYRIKKITGDFSDEANE